MDAQNDNETARRYHVSMTSKLDSATLDAVCSAIADGSSIRSACRMLGISRDAVMYAAENMPAFGRQLARARKLGGDALADELLTITDDCDDVHVARLRADNIKWLLARTHRDTYGDRVDVAVAVTVDLGQALRDAKARTVRPISDPADAIDAEYREIPARCDDGPRDNESVAPLPALVPPLSIFD